MSVAVVVPWWPTDCPWRNRWREQIISLWESRGFEVVIGEGVEGAARNRGIEACDAEIIVTCDADSIITAKATQQAIELASRAPGLVIPHDRYVYLGERQCAERSARSVESNLTAWGGRWQVMKGVEVVGQHSVGGPSVFSRDTWEMAGGYDESIVRGYDGAFAMACGILVGGQRRIESDFVHLWHPRAKDEDPPATWSALSKYQKASGEVGAMLSLLDERRGLALGSP